MTLDNYSGLFLNHYREERQKRKEEKEEEKRRKEEEKELKRRQKELEEQEVKEKQAALLAAQQAALLNHTGEVFDSMQVEFDGDENFGNLADVEDLGLNEELELEEETEPEETEEEEEEEDEEDDFGYEMPIGPLPQMVNNDLKSLDEMVSEILNSYFMPEGVLKKSYESSTVHVLGKNGQFT